LELVADNRESGTSGGGLLGAWLLTSAVYLGALHLPVGGAPLLFLTPQPGLNLERRRGLRSVIALVVLVTMSIGIVESAEAAALYLCGFATVTVLLPMGFRRQWRIERTVGVSTIVASALLALLVLGVFSTPHEMASHVQAVLEKGRQGLIDVYRQAGVAPDRLERLNEGSLALTEAVARLAPSLGVIAVGTVVLLNVLLARWRQIRLGVPVAFGDLSRWKCPPALVWALIAAGYGLFAPISEGPVIAQNVLAVVLAVYFCQGLAIVQFYMQRWRSPIWMRGLLYVFVIGEWLVASGVVLLGVFDLWGDFRRLTPRPVEEE
jgi:uncharacterized protein YybS (DUF2232 family)